MIWFLTLLSFLFTLLLIPLVADMVSTRLLRANYANEQIPVGLGVVFILAVVPLVLLAVLLTEITLLEGMIWVSTISSFGLIGFIDDTLGSREARGFTGHFRALWHGQLTTGALKALFGGVIALLVAFFTSDHGFVIILNTFLIALFANVLNLLDVRPGRAGKFYLLLTIPLIISGFAQLPSLLITASLIAYLPWDLSARVMMGDVGANILGAIFGLSVIGLPISGRLLILLLLIGLHVYAERFSLSRAIDDNTWLHSLDLWGRKKV